MITADENIRRQQDLVERHLALAVIASNAWPLVRRDVDAIAQGVFLVQPGAFRAALFDAPN